MSVTSRPCEIRRISDKSEIISILEQTPSIIQSSSAILIGSRAALRYLPNFRNKVNSEIDWDFICSSTYLLEWLRSKDEEINTIELIIPNFDEEQLDLYVTCTLKTTLKYDFAVSLSSNSYTTYLLNHIKDWSKTFYYYGYRDNIGDCASNKLLLILKKYMLYYADQWEKTANDYRQLLTITDPLNDQDEELCNLFIIYNEKLHGKRPPDTEEFIFTSSNDEQNISIKRENFLQDNKDKQISRIYQEARKISIDGNLSIGLEYICTKSPRWLADFVINNLVDIQNQKLNDISRLQNLPPIKSEIDNYRLFQELPELVIQKILRYITDPLDYKSMTLVCKDWYTILNQQTFWRDMFVSRYGQFNGYPVNVVDWKLLYFIKLKNPTENSHFALALSQIETIAFLRRITAADVLRLWENLTRRNQPVKSSVLSRINYILSNSYYYYLNDDESTYSVKIILIGLDHPRSQSNVHVNLRVGEYGSSYFTVHTEALSIHFDETPGNKRFISFMGPQLFGFEMGERHYYFSENTLLTNSPSTICPALPSGIIICLFILMVHSDHRERFIKYLQNMESNCRVY